MGAQQSSEADIQNAKLKDFCNRLKLGDLLEFPPQNDQIFSHWGIYSGSQSVIHAVPRKLLAQSEFQLKANCNTSGGKKAASFMASIRDKQPIPKDFHKKLRCDAVIRLDPINEIPNFQNVKCNNDLDHFKNPKPGNEITGDAMRQLNSKYDFHTLANNCEHFAKMYRYGEKMSSQANDFIMANSEVVFDWCKEDAILKEFIETHLKMRSQKQEELSAEEKQDREKRKLNVIVYGIADCEDNNTFLDMIPVKNLIKALDLDYQLSIPENITHTRLGVYNSKKVRPIRLTFDRMQSKVLLLKSAKKLKTSSEYRNVFIKPDLTIQQRKQLVQNRNCTSVLF